VTPAAVSTSAPNGPRLAIIIDDCGQWPVTERGFISLPVALTLSVLPHVRYGSEIAHDAQAAGKGVMLHLPMEPVSGIDPGPGRITTSMDDAAITAQVRDDIASVPLATGVNNHEGSRATADDRVMRAVSEVLAADHLFFIDSLTTGSSVAERDAHAAGIATASRDVFLDNVADVDATEAQLRRAVQPEDRCDASRPGRRDDRIARPLPRRRFRNDHEVSDPWRLFGTRRVLPKPSDNAKQGRSRLLLDGAHPRRWPAETMSAYKPNAVWL
jgi:polysaccharide deacetylase 2 family uncharacterized protein YibQ